MKNICLIVEYLGTNYKGFQRQKNGITVQAVLEEAIFNAVGQRVTLTASGRTDAGVHAVGQAVNFFTNCTVPPEKLSIAINFHLPADISVIKSFEVPPKFNARFSAKKKEYVYRICTNKHMSVFEGNRAMHYPYKVDYEVLKCALVKICGTHDFSSFMKTGGQVEDTVRTIYKADYKLDKKGILTLKFIGNGFLYNMVRILVGTILEISSGKLAVNVLDELLKGGRRPLAGKTAPACGLYLNKVWY